MSNSKRKRLIAQGLRELNKPEELQAKPTATKWLAVNAQPNRYQRRKHVHDFHAALNTHIDLGARYTASPF